MNRLTNIKRDKGTKYRGTEKIKKKYLFIYLFILEAAYSNCATDEEMLMSLGFTRRQVRQALMANVSFFAFYFRFIIIRYSVYLIIQCMYMYVYNLYHTTIILGVLEL